MYVAGRARFPLWESIIIEAPLRYPITGTPRLLRARRERPRGRRAAEQRHELATFHYPMSPVLPTERIAHLGTADCCDLTTITLEAVRNSWA